MSNQLGGEQPQQAETQEQLFDRVAAKLGKNTIMQRSPNGAYFVWVTKDEADPMTALMSIALAIMVQRGYSPDSASGITIRRVTEVVAPGCNVFWQVTNSDHVVIAKGYARDEHEAAVKIAEYVKPDVQLPSGSLTMRSASSAPVIPRIMRDGTVKRFHEGREVDVYKRPQECAASGQGHNDGASGPNGEVQCEYCGQPPV